MKISTTWNRVLPYVLAAVMLLAPLAQQSAVWATVADADSADLAGLQPAAAETASETAAESVSTPTAEISDSADRLLSRSAASNTKNTGELPPPRWGV